MGIFSKKEKSTETPAKRPASDLADAQTASIAGGASELGTTVTDASGAATGSSSGAATAGPVNDILLQVPVCEVHKVEGENETLLQKSSLVAYGVSYPDDTKRMALEVNETRWWLLQQMATLKVAPMSYMFAVAEGVFYSVTFAEDTPPEAVGTFEGLLEEVTSYRESEKLLEDPVAAEGDFKIAEGLKFSNKAASGVHGLAVKVAGGILMGANAVSHRLAEQGAKMTANSEPCANPRPLPGVVTGAASATRSTTKAASKVANKVVNAAATVPVYVVDRFSGGGKPPKAGEPLKPQSAKDQVMTASAVSFTMVYEAMESGARLVFTGARDSASGVVGHKYGPDAGKLTEDTLASGGHAFNAYTSYRNIAVRAIARKTAKTTAKRMVTNYLGKNNAQSGPDFKQQAKASVQQQAAAMKKSNKAGAEKSGGSGTGANSEHHMMLQSHNSRRQGSIDAAAAAAQQS